MDYGVILYLDTKSNNYIKDLRYKVCNNGVNKHTIDSGIKPHITLASFDSKDIFNFIEKLKIFLKDEKSFEIKFNSIGIFPFKENVVYLSPVMNMELYGIHNRFYSFFKNDNLEYGDYYLPERWVPHCTVASRLDINEVISSITTIKEEFKVFSSLVKCVGVIQVEPPKEIACIKL